MSFLDRINDANNCTGEGYRPFIVDGIELGQTSAEFTAKLQAYPDVFVIGPDSIGFADGLLTYADRSNAIAGVLADIRVKHGIHGWRDENYPVGASFNDPVFEIERGAVPLLGTRGYGVHMNGYVRDGDRLKMWIARRSLKKATAPGKLDQMVGGGQPAGLSVRDNLVKECGEEAAIPREVAETARPVSAITYRCVRPEGFRWDLLWCYDLELPADFVPVAADGEVDEFMLMDIEDVAAGVSGTTDYKFNCALVITDFLLRHGLIEADDPDYEHIVTGLHPRF